MLKTVGDIWDFHRKGNYILLPFSVKRTERSEVVFPEEYKRKVHGLMSTMNRYIDSPIFDLNNPFVVLDNLKVVAF